MAAAAWVCYVLVRPALTNHRSGKAMAAARRDVLAALQTVSPAIDDTPMATVRAGDTAVRWQFWIDCRGLGRTHPDAALDQPGAAILRAVERAMAPLGHAFVAVLGFSRFNTCCIAHRVMAEAEVVSAPPSLRSTLLILASLRDEAERAAQTPLACLGVVVRPTLQRELMRLGVDTVGQLARLPAGGLLERYGKELHQIYQLARQDIYAPLVIAAPIEQRLERAEFEDGLVLADHLVFAAKRLLERLLRALSHQHLAVATLHLELVLDGGIAQRQRLRVAVVPAHATLDALSLVRLLGHKLAATSLPYPVRGMALWATEVQATAEQLQLFAHRPRRDLAAGAEALAKLRAELGEDAVVRAIACHGHLPAARFRWEACRALVAASPQQVPLTVIRRYLDQPKRIEAPADEPTGRPYHVSGGWWAREAARRYQYTVARDGAWRWLYYDELRRAWFLQGEIE